MRSIKRTLWATRKSYEVTQPADAVTLCTMGIGTAFGEAVLDNRPHQATVITNEHCELLRIEQRDFQLMWERNRHLMEGMVTCSPMSNTASFPPSAGPPGSPLGGPDGILQSQSKTTNKRTMQQNLTNIQEPSDRLLRAGWVLRTLILAQEAQLIRDRKYHLRTFRRCLVGSEMVDWVLLQKTSRLHNRAQAIGVWQALLEEGAINHVLGEPEFKDKYVFYRFRQDEDAGTASSLSAPSAEDRMRAETELPETLALLTQLMPDAVFRMILRKPPAERTVEDLEILYEELLHIKALSHLSNGVKRELAGVLHFELHPKAGTILFNQGDEGRSWYIILRGSVNVVIYGKGAVCSLHEGDDFGKLALVNDSPRAATIITREDNCYLLRVGKDDFNRILRDVEANTVRLKEHGQDVLLLQKIPADGRNATPGENPSHYKYMVMAGTPQKMLEHLLETRIDNRSNDVDTADTFLEDFILTHTIFMPSHQLCPELMKHYRLDVRQEKEFVVASKRRVIQFIRAWATLLRDAFFEDPIIINFLEEQVAATREDSLHRYEELADQAKLVAWILDAAKKHAQEQERAGPQKWKVSVSGHILKLTMGGGSLSQDQPQDERSSNRKPIKPIDEVVFRVYCADHTYTTLKATVGATCDSIKRSASEKLGLKDDLILVEVKSSERVPIKDAEVSVPTGLSVNGRLFITPCDHLDALTPLQEQEGPSEGTASVLESLSSYDLAYHMTLYDWELFKCVHECELIYQVFGRHQFRRIMANLDVFLRRFNEVQYWVVTELCLAPSLGRRVQLLRKFIKIAAVCRQHQNLNSFFAVVMGLSNVAVSRLSQTWERLPSKLKRTFAEFEALIDPSRNHRRYRLAAAKMLPPVIPFMPLMLKDMTFSHEGNKTYLEGLVNFEKMHMIAQTLRTLRHCRSEPIVLEPPPGGTKTHMEVRDYIRSLRVIDNQRRLTQLSHSLEPRRT